MALIDYRYWYKTRVWRDVHILRRSRIISTPLLTIPTVRSAVTENLTLMSLETPTPRPGRESLLSRRGSNRRARIFAPPCLAVPIAPSGASTSTTTKVVHSIACHSPPESPTEDRDRLRLKRTTPAQEVIARYRDKIALEITAEQHVASPATIAVEPAIHCSESCPADNECDTPTSPRISVRLSYQGSELSNINSIRRSGFREAEMAQLEAKSIAQSCGDGPLRCNRDDCNDELPDVKALSLHLHIHHIHDTTVCCALCGTTFETAYGKQVHDCAPSTSTGTISVVVFQQESRPRGVLQGLISRLFPSFTD